MRNQVMDLLATVWEGVKKAKTLMPQTAEQVLTDCYLAVQTIEQTLRLGLSEAAYQNYVGLFVILKELLEEMNSNITLGISVTETAKKIKNSLKQLRRLLSDEQEVKLEAVFFPYKASMWDALESIWLAAKDDPRCDAIVVPIPYYDINPDGSLGEMHYEGWNYPSYVPIVNWREYDVESRHPDMIFIHNPYDKQNRVTSVHPDFYSKRLRAYTDMLFYSPYFVVPGDVSEHLCTTEGCIYAHKTVVQSKKICDTYVRVFKEAFGNRLGDPKEKFLPLGSPKFDKVINTKRQDYTIPDEWSRIIAKKKVVLYNTSIGPMLQSNEQYLIKLQNVLNVFRGREDVVLWWRPHPLSESTLFSMRPALTDLYRKIVDAYQQEAYGVYDDSADVNRAVAYADYYYGDSGSAVEAVFCATGKPMMIQRLGVKDDSLVLPVLLGSDGSRLFFSPLYSTAIMSFDLLSNQIQVVKPGYSTLKRPYSLGVNNKGVVYFTPVAEESILMLEPKTDQVKELPFKVDQSRLLKFNPKYKKGSNFVQSYEYDGKIFFVGYYYPAIMCYDPAEEKLTYRRGWPDTFKGGDANVFGLSCQMDSKIVIVGTSPVILLFDTETNRFTTENISHQCAANGFSAVAYGDGFLWLMSWKDGTILRFHPQTKELVEYNRFPAGVDRCECMCISSIYAQGYLWLFSDNTNAVLRLHAQSGEISVVRMFSNRTRGNAVHLGMPVLVGNKIYTSLLNYPGLTIYDVETGTYTEIPVHVALNTSDVEHAPTDIHDTIMMENGFDTIETLIRMPARDNRKLLADWISSSDGTAGEKIYQYAKGLVMPEK